MAAIGTALNPTDMGTKILSANRLRMLCAVAGMVDDGGNKVGKEELQAELYKTKGVNSKTLHLVQLLMASTLQGCTLENYEDASFYVLFFLELVGTFCEEHPNYFVLCLTAVLLLTTVFLCYLNGVRWRLSLHIGRGPIPGREPCEPNTEDTQREHNDPNTEDSQSEHTRAEHQGQPERADRAGHGEQPARAQGGGRSTTSGRRHAVRPRGGQPHERVDGGQRVTPPRCSTRN